MAWHIFEKLLEEVANQSPFIGKIWITSLFMFRLIIVASIGDTVYSDEQSAFQCNTLQPGCENICFNQFSPISQIRFWAVQILFVGTPSIVYIIYALPKLKKASTTIQKKDEKESKTNIKDIDDNMKVLEDKRESQTQKTFSTNKSHLPPYEEAVIEENGKISALSNKSRHRYDDELYVKTNGYRNIDDKVFEQKKAEVSVNDLDAKDLNKIEDINKHNINKPDVKSTPGLWRAYLLHVIFRLGMEAVFLYLQYDLYKFDVEELYICEGFPCPRIVECFVSRPKEKTLFLRFMYFMSALSLLLNITEVVYLIVVWIKKYSRRNSPQDGVDQPATSTTSSDPFWPGDFAPRSPFGNSMRPVHSNTYPMLGPFPRTHTNSFGNSSDGTIDSDYRFYDN